MSYTRIVLRTLHELFEADTAGALEAVSINVQYALSASDRETEEACIVSVQVRKKEFLED